MTVQNPSFEQAGAFPGEAAHWELVTYTRLQQIAGFGPAPHIGREDFERWGTLMRELAAPALAFFGRFGFEAFEAGWQNAVFLRAIPESRVVPLAVGPANIEDFERDWQGDDYAWDWEAVPFVAAQLSGAAIETFEAAWHNNESFAHCWSEVAHERARFDANTTVVEGFGGDWTAAARL